jgi:hypothetical protein
MSTQGSSTPQLDSQISATSTLRAARLAAIAGVAAAVLALVSSLLVVAFTGRAETERSRAEFLRGQRQVLYSKIAEHEQALVQAEGQSLNDILDIFIRQSAVTGIVDKTKPTVKALITLRHDAFALDIIGSESVRLHFGLLIKEHDKQYQNLLQVQNNLYVAKRQGRTPAMPDADPYWAINAEISRHEKNFKEAARADMGAE